MPPNECVSLGQGNADWSGNYWQRPCCRPFATSLSPKLVAIRGSIALFWQLTQPVKQKSRRRRSDDACARRSNRRPFKVAIRISPFHVDATPCCRDAMLLILPGLWPFLFRNKGGGGGVGYPDADCLAHLVVAAREHHGLVLGRAAHHLLAAAACHAFYEHFHLAAYLGAV